MEMTDDEKIELIKSYLFETLDILKSVEVKKLCKVCGNPPHNYSYLRRGMCLNCYRKELGLSLNNPSPEQIEKRKEQKRELQEKLENLKKSLEPITLLKEDYPNEIPRRTHKFNLLDGLTEEQKNTIRVLVEQLGYHPLGFTVYVDTDEIYYFGKLIKGRKINCVEDKII